MQGAEGPKNGRGGGTPRKIINFLYIRNLMEHEMTAKNLII